jgi:hypothetical protein
MSNNLPPRVPWPDDFPDVIVHGEEKARDAHPDYLAAKSGDFFAGLRLVKNLLSDQKILELQSLASAFDAQVIAVTADESLGYNAIPDAMAIQLFAHANIEVAIGDIVQSNKVSHTRSKSLQRIVSPAVFTGSVSRNTNYIILDDHAGLGGTIANLKGYLETNGGRVVGCTTLTASPRSHQLAVSQRSCDLLYLNYGDDLLNFWKEHFGHEIECLTEREAKAVLDCRAQSLDALEVRLAQAAEEVSLRHAET